MTNGCGKPGHVTGGEGTTQWCATCAEAARKLVEKDSVGILTVEEFQEVEELLAEIDAREEANQ